MVVALALALALAMPALRLVLLALLAPGLALGLVLLLPLALPALAPAGTRARRLEQLKTRRTRQREPHEASGLVRGWRRQQLPRLQGAVAAVEA